MRAHEFILNEKRRKKRKARSVAGPYYGYYYGLGTTTDSGAEGGDGGGVEEGELIPWPKGTVKVDVSDVYDWYKLGQHISNLKGLGKHDFGKGPPQTVMAFGSEPLEHEYIKDLNKIGLKTYDIDEGLVESIINKIPPSTLWAEQEEDIRQELLKNPRLFENTKDFTDLRTFLDRFGSNDIEVENNYVYSSVTSIIPGRIMSLAYFGNAHRLVGIKNNQVFFDINGKIQSYPESGGVEGDLLKQVLLFPTVEDFSKFQMLLKLKFSDWILKTKILDENVTEGNNIKILLKVNDQDNTVDVTAILDGQEVGHVNFDDSQGELIPQDLYVDPEYRGQGIAAAMYNYTKRKGYTILQGEEQSDDAVGFWAKHRPGKKVWEQGVAEGKMAELDMDLEDPEITDRQFEKMYGMTRKEARKLFSRTNMWDFPDFRDPDKPLHEQGVAESLDRPYSYHWEEGDFGDLNAYAQLSDNTVLDIEFEQINVDKSQWTVGFQRDGQIHKTGKGDEQRVFATVLSAIKEFIENKQPKEVFFSAEKSEVNPESRKRLYDRLVQKYATALGYRASQSETNWGTKYKFLRIREQGVAEDTQHNSQDLKDVAQWMRTTPDKLNIVVKQEPIEKFINQIREMYGTYDEYPKDEERTNRILKLLKHGAKPLPMYVEKDDTDLFVMEGRHRMVAFWLAGMKTVPIAYVSVEKQGVTESLDFEEGDCPIFAIALHRLSKLPLMALVEYDEEMGSTVLIHAYVKLNDAWRVDASGETNVPHMLAKFPNNGAAQEVQISEKDLIKLGYEKNKCPSLSEVLPYAKKILQDIKQGNLIEFAPGPDFRDDDDRQDMPLLEFAKIIKLFLGSEYTMIDRKTPEQVSVKFDPKDRTSGHNGAVLYSVVRKQNEYPTVNFQLIDYEQGPQVGRGRRAGTAILKTRANALKIADIIYNTMGLPQQDRRVEENFADGKNPGRKGLAKRMGVPTKASVSRLRQIAKSSSGEKQRMAHWMANMKAGRKK